MDEFEQFFAFQRCREFVRAVAEPLNLGVFSKDRFSHAVAQDDVVDLLEIRGRFRARRQSGVFAICLNREGLGW